MDRSLVFATSVLAPLPALARGAEAAGFHRLWTTEFTDRDALVRALVVANATDHILVGTGIAYSFTRHPLALATAALDVHEASNGRLTLGLGAGTRGMRQRWYDIDQPKPVSHLLDVVAFLRAAWQSDGHFEHHSEHYQCAVDGLHLRSRFDKLPGLGIYGSGVNPGMIAAAARSCDGVALHPLAGSPTYLRDTVLPAVASSPGAAPRVALWAVTSIDEDGDRARDRARRALAFYYSTPSYSPSSAEEPWADVPPRIVAQARSAGHDWAELASLIPDQMLDALALSGTPAEVRTQVRELEARLQPLGIDEIVFQTVGVDVTDDEAVHNCELIIGTCGPQNGEPT
jgi:alkanesulfonate monooxygenase SsuD/methylene tetrahydromethanopterin reductase-like flavin-dependent oxidoreductase (luciferase family)